MNLTRPYWTSYVKKHMSTYQDTESRGGLRVHRKATRTDSKKQNRRFVLQCIFNDRSISRADIARTTGLTRATVSEIVAEFLDEDLVLEVGTAPSGGGKPPTLLSIAEDAYHVLVVRLGGNHWTGTVMTLRRRLVRSTTVSSSGQRGAPAIAELTDFVQRLIDSTSQEILGIGISTPGTVTREGTVREAVMIDWHEVQVGKLLSENFSMPIHIMNDAKAIALAEHALGGHDSNDLVAVKVATGVGSGIIVNGRPYSGEGSAAGEIGQLSVLSSPFGEDGHETLEEITSAPAFARLLGIGTSEFVDSTAVFSETARRLAVGDPDALEVTRCGAQALGVVLAMVTGILDMKTIVICGPATQLGERYLDLVRAELVKRSGPAYDPSTTVTYGTVDRPEEHGAAMLVLNRELGIL
jgi:N-acetylglucosamine repressor